jgi:hypothetical protein
VTPALLIVIIRDTCKHSGAIASVPTAPAVVDATNTNDANKPKRVRVPTLDMCKYLLETISTQFDPQRALLRHTFFIDTDKSRYVSVGYYPARNYNVLFEFGGPKFKHILLAEHHVGFMAAHLSQLCNEKP